MDTPELLRDSSLDFHDDEAVYSTILEDEPIPSEPPYKDRQKDHELTIPDFLADQGYTPGHLEGFQEILNCLDGKKVPQTGEALDWTDLCYLDQEGLPQGELAIPLKSEGSHQDSADETRKSHQMTPQEIREHRTQLLSFLWSKADHKSLAEPEPKTQASEAEGHQPKPSTKDAPKSSPTTLPPTTAHTHLGKNPDYEVNPEQIKRDLERLRCLQSTNLTSTVI